jgi:tRNA (adenine37-N6)-methyltransferase
MKNEICIKPIGYIRKKGDIYAIELEKKFIPALSGLNGFNYLNIIWWGSLVDEEKFRNTLTVDKPYQKAPDKLGIFATRSPIRPNPVLISPVYVLNINFETGIIQTPYIDAEDGTPVIDIKPYLPCADKIKNVEAPDWCMHWPKWYEDSASFNWEAEFTFSGR